MYQNVTEGTRSHHNVSEGTRRHHNVSEGTRMYHNVPERTIMYQKVPECTRKYHNVPECTGMYQQVPECTSVDTEEVVSASEGGSNRRLEGLPDLYSSTNIIRLVKTKNVSETGNSATQRQSPE